MAGVGPFIEVKVEGLAELEQNLLKLPEDLAKRALGIAARRAMESLRRKIAAAAPILKDADSRRVAGQLQRGIKMRSKFIGDGVKGGTIVVTIGLQLSPKESTAFYGRFIELGTIKMQDHKFMKPAFDAGATEVLNQFGKELEKAIEQVARRAARKLAA